MIEILIPARRGSTRIKNKNLQSFGELDLITNTVVFAELLPHDNITVFTDYDAVELTERCSQYYMRRAPESATETAYSDAYLLEFCKNKKGSIIVLLQPTSPFRSTKYIKRCIEEFRYLPKGSLLCSGRSINEVLYRRNKLNEFYTPISSDVPRRQQEREPFYHDDGNVYIFNSDDLIACNKLGMLNWRIIENSFPYTIDINNMEDLKLARIIRREYFGL